MGIARDVGREIEIEKTVKITEIAVKEEIVSVTHRVSEKNVEVFTQLKNNSNEVLKSDTTLISGNEYEEFFNNTNVLVSDEKIWEIIDKIRNS